MIRQSTKLFGRKCALIGVVHVLPLPGSPSYDGDMDRILAQALKDAAAYREGGADALMLENMHDVPYLKGYAEPETTAAMAAVAKAVKAETKRMPMGLQILAGANCEALAVAVACDLDFIRVEGFVYAHVGDEGIHESDAAKLLRRRAALKAEGIKIFADVKKKHAAHAITSDVDITETARTAEFFKADGVIVTGTATGHAPDASDVETVRAAVSLPVLIGSGITDENVFRFAEHCDGVIVGTSAKRDGLWANAVEKGRVEKLAAAMAKVR
ncbi:MAG TPA: BtpA/SgcQ family protein [Candidatus Obscuribacterales bacterium]